MPYTLGITIDGTRITDDDAKIIGLSLMGLNYKKIAAVTYINDNCIRNKVSALNGMFGLEKGITGLTLLGVLNGFDYYCHVNGHDILNEHEHRRLEELNPTLLRLTKRICLSVQ